jgi:hypothetical protein
VNTILPQPAASCQIEPYQSKNVNVSEILALADACLAQFNEQWACWLATGDDMAFRLALAAKQDREALLSQIGGASWLS